MGKDSWTYREWLKALLFAIIAVVLGYFLFPRGAQPQNSKEAARATRMPPSVQAMADSHLAGLPTSPTEWVRPEYDGKKPKDVPEAASEKEAFYRNAKVLEQRDAPPDADGITKRERLIYAEGEKYPKIRVEEQVRLDATTGDEILVSRVAMIADHVLVQLPSKVSDDELAEVADRYGLTVNRRLRANDVVIFDIPEAHLESVPLALKKLGVQISSGIPVVTAEADFVVHSSQTNRVPNDPGFSNLWAMQNTGQSGGQSGDDIAATGAWSISTGTSSIVVAVIDTGIDMTHPDLAANIYTNTRETAGNGADDDHNGYVDDVHGWNFVADNNNPTDDHYHGTHCAGTIGAVGDNGNGVAGVTWHVSLLPLKFLSSSGAGVTSDAIEAIAYATALRVDVMSNSWGGGGYSALLKSAIENAGNQGIVFVAAAGNDSCNTDITPEYPSAYDSPSIISVAASDANDQLAGFSNYGSASVDLAAPGVGIYSTAPGGSYRYLNGTSMATPHVAGACALLKAMVPSLSVADLKSRLLASVDQKPGLAATVSHGRLNVMKMLYSASGPLVRLKSLNPSDAPAAGAQGNGDGTINPGENIVVQPVLENTGSETAQGIAAVLSLKTPSAYVTVTQPNCTYPDILGRQTASGRVPFRVQIDPAAPTPLTVTLLLQVSDKAGHSWQSTSDLTVYSGSIVSGRVTAISSGTMLSAATVSYSGPVSGSVTTAGNGSYSVALIDGTYALTAAANGYQSSDPVKVIVPPLATGVNFALGKPSVSITPSALEVSLNQGQSAARTLAISNSGNRPLSYTILTGYGLSSYLNVSGSSVGASGSTGLPFFEDFESGTLANWVADATSGTRNIASNVAAAGKYSLHIQSGNTNYHQSGVHHDLPVTAQPKNIRFSVRAGSCQNDAAFFVVCDRNTNKELIWFYAASSGNFYCNGSTGGSQTYTYEAQRWYDIEFRNLDWTAKKFDYYVNGFPVQTGVSFRNPTSVTGASRFYLYNYDSGSEAWWDNVVVSGDGVCWLGETPTSGTVAAGATQNVTVNFNATGLPNADYTANLIFQTNAPSTPTVAIPATLHVLSVPNNPPTATSKTVTIPEDADATITLPGSDPDGNLLSAAVTSLPAKGALYQVFSSGALGPQITSVPATVVSPDFKVLFRPVPYQDGTPYDSFGFKMNDGRADSAAATITVNVTHVNHAPVARNDVASSPTGAAIPSIPVLVNDSDADNDSLTIASITQGIHGTAAINADGTLSYTPKSGFINGNDTFTYTVRDPAGLTATATVLIRVGNLMGGDWPTFGVNPQHTGYYPACLAGGTFQSVWAQQCDYAPNQVAIAGGRIYSTPYIYFKPATLRSIDLSSGAQVWSQTFGSPYSLNPPTWFNGKLYVQRCNNSGDTQLYCVDAGSGSVNWTAPFGSQWERYCAPAVTADGIWMDGGVFGGLYGFNLDGSQKFFNSAIGQYDEWTPTVGDDGTIYSWVAGTFRAHNPSSGTVLWTSTASWSGYSANSVTAVANNKAYVIGSPGLCCFNLQMHALAWFNTNSFKGSPAVANGIVYAISGSQVLSFDATTGAALGSFVTSDSGLFYQPIVTDDSLLISSSSNTYLFSLSTRKCIQTIPFGGYLSLSDGALVIAGNSDKYLRVYRVSASGNHPPVATPQTVSMVEDTAVTVTLAGTDADAEPVYPIITRLPLKGTVYQTADGVTRGNAIAVVPSLINDPKGRVIYAADQYGSGANFDAFGFEVSDGRAISPEAAITLNVTHVNHAPSAVDDATGTRIGQSVTIRPTLNDQDVDGDPLTIQSFTQGGHGTVSQNGDGTLLYTPNADFTAGQDTFTYTIADTAGLTSTANITVSIGQLLNGPDWSTFGNGPAHTGYSPTILGAQPWVERWNRNFGSAALNQVATGDGKVFVIPSNYSGNGQVWAVDAISGAGIWHRDIGCCSSMNPPTYDTGKVYFQNGHGTYAPPSQLSCLDSSDGHDLWRMPIAAQWESYYAPTVANGGVWVNGGTYGGMYGFDAVTGVQKFFVTLQQYDDWTPTAGADGTMYSWVAGTFTAHDPNSGSPLWSLTIPWNWNGYSMNTISAFYGGRAYVIGNPGLFSIKLSTHTIAWSSTNAFTGSPATANGLVYAIANTGEVRAFNASTGQQLYTYPTGDTGVANQPIITNDTLLVASSSKTYIFELYTARLLQTIPVGGKLSLANDKIYIAGGDGTLHVFGRPVANNHKPVAVAAQATILEDSQVALTLEGTDADGDRLHALVTQLPAKGALYQTSDGTTPGAQILQAPTLVSSDKNTVIYIPDADGNGLDYGSFMFAMSDGRETSDPALFKIDVTPVNDAPVAYNDNVTTAPRQVISDLRLLANDIDVDGDSLTITSFTAPAHGVVERNADGSLRYTPDPAFTSGTDTFTYTISDPSGATATGTATILVSGSAGADWPTFGNGPAHTGYTPVNLGSQAWVAGWTSSLGTTALNQVAVGNGHVFVAPSSRFANAFLVSLDAVSGAENWRYIVGSASSMNPPTYANGRVYFQNGKGSSAPPCLLTCLDAGTGGSVWTQPIAAQWESYYAPAVADGGVWVNGGYYGGMYGFDGVTGTQKFFVSLDQVDEWTPAYVSGTLYSCLNGNFRAHSATSGTTLWNVSIDSSLWDSNLVVADNLRAYIATSTGLYCVGLDTHVVSWKQDAAFNRHAALANGLVYAMANTGDVRAFNASNGKLSMTYATGDTGLNNQPILTNDSLIVASSAKTYIFELYTGQLLQTIPFGGVPSLAGGRLYLAGADGTLRTYGRPNPNNVPPVAIPGSVTIDEDTATVIQLKGSDSNSDPIKAVITKLPAGGTLYQTADGTTAGAAITQAPATVTNADHKVFYRPAPNANGAGYGTFEFLMSDAYSYSPSTQYIVNVTPVNDAPVANDDTAATQPGQLLSPICVLNNDVDVDGDPLSIVSFTKGTYGDVSLNTDGSFSYLPHDGVTEAQDSFTYVIRDPSGLTSQATVRIFISAKVGTNWPTFGGGSDHSGYVPANLGIGAWASGWTYTINGHSLQQVAVVDGMVALAPNANSGTFLVGLNAADGTLKWRHDFAQAFSLCPPSVLGGNVYIQRGNAGSDTQLWCLSATSGTTVWSSPFGAQWENYFAPAVSANGIWIDGGTYGGLYGFNPNGTRKFFASLPQYDLWTPSIGADGTVYSWVEGIFTAHQPDTGAKLWSVNAGWDWCGWSMRSTTALSGGKAFAIGSPGLFAIDLNTQALAWSSTSSFTGSPAAAGGVVYAISGNKVNAYNAGSGGLLTTYSTGDAGTLMNQPILSNDLLFISSATKTYIFELYTARLLQTLNAGGYLSLANKVLYIAGSDGTLRTYNAPTALWFSPDGAQSDNPVNVTLTAANSGATIFYSLDGSPPQLSKRTVSSGGVVRIESTSMLKAVALSGNNQVSPVKQAQYTITDSNNNGLPDWWEKLHYGSLKSSVDAQDMAAFVAGVDPVKSGKTIGITSLKSNAAGGFEVAWPSINGRAYIVERSSDLQNWTSISNEITGTGGNMSLTDPSVLQNGKCFYRVRISQ